MRRLRDLPGVLDLERCAALNPSLAAMSAIVQVDAFDEVSTALWGVTARHVLLDENRELPDDSPVYHDTEAQEVAAFAKAGWDVTDEYGRPLLILKHFEWQLACVIAGGLQFRPGVLENAGVEAWEDRISAEAAKWRRKRS